MTVNVNYKEPDSLSYKLCTNSLLQMATYLYPAMNNQDLNLLSNEMIRNILLVLNGQLVTLPGRQRLLRDSCNLVKCALNEMEFTLKQSYLYLCDMLRERGYEFLGPKLQYKVLRSVVKLMYNGQIFTQKQLVSCIFDDLHLLRKGAIKKKDIGSVLRLLHRAHCFKVIKRFHQLPFFQLIEEYRMYANLEYVHDTQILYITSTAGLEFNAVQWSNLLHGDKKSEDHMKPIVMNAYQSPIPFYLKVETFMNYTKRYGDPLKILQLNESFEKLISLNSRQYTEVSYDEIGEILRLCHNIITRLIRYHDYKYKMKNRLHCNILRVYSMGYYKTALCYHYSKYGMCFSGEYCSFAHNSNELYYYRNIACKILNDRHSAAALPSTSAQCTTNNPPRTEVTNKLSNAF